MILVALFYALGFKFPRLLDHIPTVAIIVRSIVVATLHACYHFEYGVSQEINRSQFNGSVLFVYITMGISLVSNFRVFMLITTPVFLVTYSTNLYLLTAWPTRGENCKVDSFDEEVIGSIRFAMPVFLGLYFSNKTLVMQFSTNNLFLTQQAQIEKILKEQPDGVVILSKNQNAP